MLFFSLDVRIAKVFSFATFFSKWFWNIQAFKSILLATIVIAICLSMIVIVIDQ